MKINVEREGSGTLHFCVDQALCGSTSGSVLVVKSIRIAHMHTRGIVIFLHRGLYFRLCFPTFLFLLLPFSFLRYVYNGEE